MEGCLDVKLGELFSGPGGIACGIKMASESKVFDGRVSVKHVWSNDFDHDTCETYRHNIDIAKTAVYCKDVRKLDIEGLASINALAFGFPCNDYSVVGEKKGMSGTYGPLYSYGVKTLVDKQPLWFFAENVSGLRNSNDGKDFEIILQDMFDAGYDLFPNLYCFE